MEAELKLALRTVGNAFAAATGLAQSTIWARAAKDARFLERVESGKGFTIKTYDAAMEWFSENWPDGVSWPSEGALRFLPGAPREYAEKSFAPVRPDEAA